MVLNGGRISGVFRKFSPPGQRENEIASPEFLARENQNPCRFRGGNCVIGRLGRPIGGNETIGSLRLICPSWGGHLYFNVLAGDLLVSAMTGTCGCP